jgi:hypothetical protein
MKLRRPAQLAGLGAAVLILIGPLSMAQAHPSCSTRDASNSTQYNYAYPAFTHVHDHPKEQWVVNVGKSTYAAPGAELAYMVSKAAPWWSPVPWYPPYKTVYVWCPNFSGWGD